MSSGVFTSDIWTTVELKAMLKKLEEMYAGGVRQSSFKDQTLIFGSTSELKQRISDLSDAICSREVEEGTATANPAQKKIVKMSTRGKGFC